MKSLTRVACFAAVLTVAACGPDDDNNDNGSTNNNNGSTNNAATNNAATNNAATNNTATNNTATNNAATNNTATNNAATNNAATNNGPDCTPTNGVSFSNDIVPIIANSCATGPCHGGGGNGTAFAIDDPADATTIQAALEGVDSNAGPPLVDPCDPDNSEIWLRVSGTARTQMPLTGGPLSQEDIDLIRDWIADGAPFDN